MTYTIEDLAERYTCSVCGKTIAIEECDRNLIADWAHCDVCMGEMMAGYSRYMRWEWLWRPWQHVRGAVGNWLLRREFGWFSRKDFPF